MVNVPGFFLLLATGPFAELKTWEVYSIVYPFYIWTTASIALFFIYLLKDLFVNIWKFAVKLARPVIIKIFPQKRRSKRSFDPIRRSLLITATAGLSVPPVALSTFGIIYGSKEFFITDIELLYPELPENLRGIKIAQLSDIHCSPYTTKDYISKAVGIINGYNVDVVLLTGDYVPRTAGYIHPCMEALKELKSVYGVFASMGNHDFWTDISLITREMQKYGFTVLRNQGLTLNIREEKINILGVDDSRWAHADLVNAQNMGESGLFSILLSHQPIFWEVAKMSGIDLTLAGHTHGGQVGLELPGLSMNFGDMFHRYNKGLFEDYKTKLYVNQGLGFTGPPIRLNTPPEITIITLT